MTVTIGRRELLAALGGAAAAWPLAARAQQGGKRYTIGILSAGGAGVQAALDSAFFDGLRELGWVEGKNVVFENRNAENRLERLPELAADLVRLKGRCHCGIRNSRALSGQAGRQDHSNRHDSCGRPVGERAGCQSGATRRQRYGDELMVPDLGAKRLELLKE